MLNFFDLKIFFNDDDIISYLSGKGYRVTKINKEKINNATAKARNTYSRKVREKLDKALQIIISEGKDVNPTILSKVSNTNWRTAKKYLSTPEVIQKIDKQKNNILFKD